MSRKETRKYLNQFRDCQFGLEHTSMMILKWETIATKTTIALQGDKVQTSSSEKLSDSAIKIVELKDELAKKNDRLIMLFRKISDQIDHLENEEYKKILELRYLECLPFNSIPDRMHMSRATVFRTHDKALDAFEEKYHNQMNNETK